MEEDNTGSHIRRSTRQQLKQQQRQQLELQQQQLAEEEEGRRGTTNTVATTETEAIGSKSTYHKNQETPEYHNLKEEDFERLMEEMQIDKNDDGDDGSSDEYIFQTNRMIMTITIILITTIMEIIKLVGQY